MALSPQVAAYLERIGFSGDTTPCEALLSQLQYLHFGAVPYENLDILRGIPISLEIPDLFDKIVVRRRGGYCFELNALFAWLLSELGFNVSSYFARFLRGETEIPKRRHHVLIVAVRGKQYLCDVGVGAPVPRRPVLMEEGLVSSQDGMNYCIRHEDFFGTVLYEEHCSGWRRVYSFTPDIALPVDFTATSYFCEHAPQSPFNKKAIVAIRTPLGRNTVDGDEFRVFENGNVRVFQPTPGREYDAALKTHFGIVLNI